MPSDPTLLGTNLGELVALRFENADELAKFEDLAGRYQIRYVGLVSSGFLVAIRKASLTSLLGDIVFREENIRPHISQQLA